ncbi:hypothetical protein HDV01_001771 [Terramyces sp. JEL0728]|nr:hypothetical protein HDV01_001771 [Terramyces sp. JEL0728]
MDTQNRPQDAQPYSPTDQIQPMYNTTEHPHCSGSINARQASNTNSFTETYHLEHGNQSKVMDSSQQNKESKQLGKPHKKPFQEQQIQNIGFLVVFIIFSIIYLGSSAYLIAQLVLDSKKKQFSNAYFNLAVIIAPSVVSLIGGLVTFNFVCVFPIGTFYLVMLGMAGGFSYVIYLLFNENQSGMASLLIIILVVLVVGGVSVLIGMKKRLFSKLIQFTNQLKLQHRRIFFASGINVVIQVVFTIYWVLGLVAFNHFASKKEIGSFNLYIALYVFYVFMLFWASQTITNFHRVATITGIVSKNSVPDVLARTFNNMGQITFASLILVVSEFLSIWGNGTNANCGTVLIESEMGAIFVLICGCLSCVCVQFGKRLRFISRFAFTNVAFHGSPFLEAARNSFSYREAKGLSRLYSCGSDSAYFLVLNVFVGALSCFCSVYLYSKEHSFSAAYYAVGSVAFFIGIAVSSSFSASIDASMTAIIVNYSEFPSEFQNSYPDFYQYLFDKFPIQ